MLHMKDELRCLLPWCSTRVWSGTRDVTRGMLVREQMMLEQCMEYAQRRMTDIIKLYPADDRVWLCPGICCTPNSVDACTDCCCACFASVASGHVLSVTNTRGRRL